MERTPLLMKFWVLCKLLFFLGEEEETIIIILYKYI